MPPTPPKKRTCAICDTEHDVGDACPNCGWHQEKEEAQIKAELKRKEMREAAGKPPKPENKGWF